MPQRIFARMKGNSNSHFVLAQKHIFYRFVSFGFAVVTLVPFAALSSGRSSNSFSESSSSFSGRKSVTIFLPHGLTRSNDSS